VIISNPLIFLLKLLIPLTLLLPSHSARICSKVFLFNHVTVLVKDTLAPNSQGRAPQVWSLSHRLGDTSAEIAVPGLSRVLQVVGSCRESEVSAFRGRRIHGSLDGISHKEI